MTKVSVIIAAYNCQDSIGLALNSIISQDYQDWECIICDDGSTDDTWERIIKITLNNEKFTVLKNKFNLGIAVTLNRCINIAKGEYIAIQDADDFSEKERLTELVDFLDNNSDVSVVGSYAYLFDKNGRRWGELKPPLNPRIEDWLRGFFIIHASSLMRRKDIIEAGRYDANYKRVQDYDLWLNLIYKGYKIVTMPGILYNVRWDVGDYSRRKLKYRMIEAKIIYKGLKKLNAHAWNYIYIIKTMLSGMLHPQIMHLYYLYRFGRKQNKRILKKV